MLLKRIDELIVNGLFDITSQDEDVEVYLTKPILDREKQIFCWEKVDEGPVKRSILHYDDTNDASNALVRSFQNFYASEKEFADGKIYNGSSNLFKDGLPTFGGTAKAAVYLRYSTGFINFLKEFDVKTATALKNERTDFETFLRSNLPEGKENKTKKMPGTWLEKPKDVENKWILPTICKLSTGKYIVPFLEPGAETDDYEDLADLGVDIDHSLKLASFFTSPAVKEQEVIDDLFQMGEGLGRNPFSFNLKNIHYSDSEYLRLMGILPQSSRSQILALWKNRSSIEYRLPFYPYPESSSLIFIPEGTLKFSQLANFIKAENLRRDLFFEAQRAKKNKIAAEEVESLKIHQAALVPVHSQSTIFMVNTEGTQKKKLIIQRVISSVELDYFTRLNELLRASNLQNACCQYDGIAITGDASSKTPSIYRYWTEIFTNALQKQYISCWDVYSKFQQFAKGQPGKELIENRKANNYFILIGKLLQLQHLIGTAREKPEHLAEESFIKELESIAKFERTPEKGVFGMKNPLPVQPEVLIGETNYECLRDWEKTKFEKFLKRAMSGVPGYDFPIFARGALIGILLQELCYAIEAEGRKYSVTQGRQMTRLRGSELTAIFTKGVEILLNLKRQQRFNCQMLGFIKSEESESFRNSFNNGLIMGMTFFDKEETNNQQDEVSND